MVSLISGITYFDVFTSSILVNNEIKSVNELEMAVKLADNFFGQATSNFLSSKFEQLITCIIYLWCLICFSLKTFSQLRLYCIEFSLNVRDISKRLFSFSEFLYVVSILNSMFWYSNLELMKNYCCLLTKYNFCTFCSYSAHRCDFYPLIINVRSNYSYFSKSNFNLNYSGHFDTH